MSRQDQNKAFLETSFLYGGNAAYIEQLEARYAKETRFRERLCSGLGVT